MKTEKISCALTTWNSNAYLEKQLDSLNSQSVPFDEVIIVDDASTNDTVQRLHAYIEKHHLKNWRVIVHPANQGFISTFQDALAATSGDLIFLCDHDDLWYPDKVEIMSKQFDVRPGLQVLACSFDLIDGADRKIEDKVSSHHGNHNLIRKPVIPGGFTPITFEDLMGYNFAPGCTLALTREIKDQYLNRAMDLKLPHDWAISAIAAIQNGLGYLDQPLIGYRQHGTNTLGLARRTSYVTRTQTALLEAEQKKSLSTLAKRFHASSWQQVRMNKVANMYARRARSLKKRNPMVLLPLFFAPVPKGFRLTLGMDLKTMMEKK